MTFLHTAPLPLPPDLDAHEHAWLTESRHATAAGFVLYVRCANCGIHRVDLQELPTAPPAALSRPLGHRRWPR